MHESPGQVGSNQQSGVGLCWREVWILYAREMRSALRERAVVFNSILLPIFLYPFILWAAFTGIIFVQGQTEKQVSRVVVKEWPKGHPALRRAFERETQLQLIPNTNTTAQIEEAIRQGALDALVEFMPVETHPGLAPPNYQARLSVNESKERSAEARRRVQDVLEEHRQNWLKREALARGIPEPDWHKYNLLTRNIASGKQVGSFLLGLLLPILFVVMVAMGCFFPAVDATAGERERHTWESLMSTAASRVSIVVSKYLYVTTLGGLAGALNLLAMLATVKPIFAPLMEKAGQSVQFALPLGAVPLLVLAAILLAGFVAAGMMLFALFARTFREGQAMVTPFYLLVMLPMMFLQVPGLTLSLPLALVPVVNVTMMVRAAVSNSFPVLPIVVTVMTSVAVIALCLRAAAALLQFEEVMVGSYEGSLGRFIQKRLARRMRARPKREGTPMKHA